MNWPQGEGEMAERVRAHDWAATPLGATEAWPERIKAVVELVLASPLVSTVALGDDRRLIYNDAAARLYGDRHPAALGQPLAETFADSYPQVAALYDRVFAGEAVSVLTQPLAVGTDGGGEVFDAYLTPVPDGAGGVFGAHMVGLEVGERVRVASALRDSEERFRAFVTASADVVYRMSPDWSEMRQLEGRDFLRDTGEPDTDWIDLYIHPADQAEVRAAIDLAIRNKMMFELEHRIIRVDDSLGWTHSRAVPILDVAGDIREWLGAASDVTERRRGEEALRESEERQAFLLQLSDALRPLTYPVAVQEAAVNQLGAALRVDRCYYTETDWKREVVTVTREYLGKASYSLIGDHPLALFETLHELGAKGNPVVCSDVASHPVFGPEADAYRDRGVAAFVVAPLVKNHRTEAFMCVTMEQPRSWTDEEVQLLSEVAERTWAAVERARAEMALQESEGRLQLLVAELQHRARNILTVVRSVFMRTVERGGPVNEIADHFSGRLASLARTQVVITQTASGDVDLENLIRDELLSVGAVADGGNVTIIGPDISLPAKTAESIGLAIHELTTNAIKYGALGQNEGKLRIAWTTNVVYGGGRKLVLKWTEQGVPAIAVKPARYGFGSELIEEALPYRLGAETELEFRGGGLRCTISLPLPALDGAAATQ